MPLYDVCYRYLIPVHAHADIEAGTPEEAIEKAKAHDWRNEPGEADWSVPHEAAIAYIDEVAEDGKTAKETVYEFIDLDSPSEREDWRQFIIGLANRHPPDPSNENLEDELWGLIKKARSLVPAEVEAA